MTQLLHVLIVEDSEDDYLLLLDALATGGFTTVHRRVETEREMAAAFEETSWDIVISDYNLPSFDGFAALELLKSRNLDIPFILRSGTVGESVAVEAMKAGAHDYIMKDNFVRLVPAIQHLLREAKTRKDMKKALNESEDRLRQSQKLEAIGRLAGGIAHDFNNMLGAITLYCDLIADELANPEEIRKNMEEIRQVAVRGSTLTRQLLVFSRRQVVQLQTVDLNRLIIGLQNMLSTLIGENIKIVLKLSDGLKPIKADPGQMEQVLMNLVVNARDAMPDGGRILIETDNRLLDGSVAGTHSSLGSGEYVSLNVSDTGHGMDEATASRIFEPFFTTKPVGKGTGLGLATVYGIVHQTGGAIRVESEVGKGTTFNTYLPISSEPTQSSQVQPAQEEERSPSARACTILVVEDEERLRLLFSEVLRRRGYQILSAGDGKEALRVCQAHPGAIHLLLTDVLMPEMGGFELAQKARDLRKDLRVLFMSGYTNDDLDHRDPGLELIQKPFNTHDLVARVRELLTHL